MTVMVELPPEVMRAGANETRAPLGAPVAVSATDWGLPVVTVDEIVLVVADPATTEAAFGTGDNRKSSVPVAVTVSVRVVDSVEAVPVPVTVIG